MCVSVCSVFFKTKLRNCCFVVAEACPREKGDGRSQVGGEGLGWWVSFCYHGNGVVVHVRDENKCHLPPEIIQRKNTL